MGEWSKSIGEKGEEIVKFIFEDILEFNSLIENKSIICNKGEKHKNSTAIKNKSTHGLDGLLYYSSPVEDELLDIILISSKYTLSYPQNPKSLFKSHLKDLAFAIECFNGSKYNSEINQRFSNVNKTEITGVLVWLSNEDHVDFDMASKVSNINIDGELIFDRILLLDNRKVNFLYESIFASRKLYGNKNLSYVYHNSSLNYNSQQSLSYGKVFPVNYLYSEIIPLRVEINHAVSLIIYINDDFSNDNFSQIMSFARTFDLLDATEKTIICYRKYDKILNEEFVKDVLIGFQTYKLGENLLIKKFPTDFRDN